MDSYFAKQASAGRNLGESAPETGKTTPEQPSARVIAAARGAPFTTDERCRIVELLNDPACPDVSLAEARVAPGVTTALHVLAGVAERYVIVSGEGVAEIDGVATRVRAGDAVLIPPGAAQRIANTGAADLVFHCICTPRFRQAAYRNLETGL